MRTHTRGMSRNNETVGLEIRAKSYINPRGQATGLYMCLGSYQKSGDWGFGIEVQR